MSWDVHQEHEAMGNASEDSDRNLDDADADDVRCMVLPPIGHMPALQPDAVKAVKRFTMILPDETLTA